MLQCWLKERGIIARFVEPGSPWQNGVNESFNGRFRAEYNDIRPHSSLDYRAPSEVRAEFLKRASDSGQASQAGPSLRPELASTDTANP